MGKPSPCADCQAEAEHSRAAPGRYCAPARCYCGHAACPAFWSWRRRPHLAVVPDPPKPRPVSTAWDDRDEDTWIDAM